MIMSELTREIMNNITDKIIDAESLSQYSTYREISSFRDELNNYKAGQILGTNWNIVIL